MTEKKDSKQARHGRKKREEGSDCGAIDLSLRDWKRWEDCRDDSELFLTSYFPNSTGLRPFSEDHKRMIARMQGCVRTGGRLANIVYRGFAKTSCAESVALWAVLYGHRKFIPIIAANAEAAKAIVQSLKMELSENDLLAADFPHACQPIRALEGKPQRCANLTCEGVSTFMEWKSDKIALPTVAGFEGSGAIILGRGLLSGTLGMKHKRPDGVQQRPDFLIIDDPQTRESAVQPAQIAKRRKIIDAGLLKLGGHRNPIAACVNATVIAPDDLADQLLDHKRSPAWQSERVPMVRSWADSHDTLWLTDYAGLRQGFDPELVGDQQRAHLKANEFYAEHREAMDAGCRVSWEWCYAEANGDPNQVPELSAIQHAYNLLIDDGPEVFASECQCEPLRPETLDTHSITKEQIGGKIIGLARGIVPSNCTHLTAAIDCGSKLLWWGVVAWTSDCSGHLVDYGAFPDQMGSYFTNANAKRTIEAEFPGTGPEGALTAALEKLSKSLLLKAWPRAESGTVKIGKLVVDANWETDVVDRWAERSAHSALILPSHGKFYGATSRILLSDYVKQDGETIGNCWLLGRGRTKKKGLHLLIDSNKSKSFLANRLQTPVGDKGSLTICADPRGHQLLIDHLLAETCLLVHSAIRSAEEWKSKPGRPDNHWLDVMALNGVAAGVLGCNLDGMTPLKKERKRVKFSELQAQARR